MMKMASKSIVRYLWKAEKTAHDNCTILLKVIEVTGKIPSVISTGQRYDRLKSTYKIKENQPLACCNSIV